MKSIKLLAIALGLSAGSTLFGLTVNYDALVDGTSSPAGSSITATGGALEVATKNGVTFLGVSGGAAGPEIDLGQSVDITFDEGLIFSELTFALLFNGPEYGDLNEVAASLTNGVDEYRLVVTGEGTGDWYKGLDFVTNVTGVSTVNGGTGLWTIVNPFGDSKVTSLSIYPLHSDGTSNSDFGLVSFKASVPDAGSSLALLGLALLGLAGFARRSARA